MSWSDEPSSGGSLPHTGEIQPGPPPPLTKNGCECREQWSLTDRTCLDGDTIYSGCGMIPPCDNDDGGVEGQSWCLIKKVDTTMVNCKPAGPNFDYCSVDGTYPSQPEEEEEETLGLAIGIGVVVIIAGVLAFCICLHVKHKQKRNRIAAEYCLGQEDETGGGARLDSPTWDQRMRDAELTPKTEVGPTSILGKQPTLSPGLSDLGRAVRVSGGTAPAATELGGASSVYPYVQMDGAIRVERLASIVQPGLVGVGQQALANRQHRGRFFVPSSVVVEPKELQSFLTVHTNGDDDTAVARLRLGPRPSLDSHEVSQLFARNLAGGGSSSAEGTQRSRLIMRVHLEKFRLRFRPALPERGVEALDSEEFAPQLLRHRAALSTPTISEAAANGSKFGGMANGVYVAQVFCGGQLELEAEALPEPLAERGIQQGEQYGAEQCFEWCVLSQVGGADLVIPSAPAAAEAEATAVVDGSCGDQPSVEDGSAGLARRRVRSPLSAVVGAVQAWLSSVLRLEAPEPIRFSIAGFDELLPPAAAGGSADGDDDGDGAAESDKGTGGLWAGGDTVTSAAATTLVGTSTATEDQVVTLLAPPPSRRRVTLRGGQRLPPLAGNTEQQPS